jgi:hypothetical protein
MGGECRSINICDIAHLSHCDIRSRRQCLVAMRWQKNRAKAYAVARRSESAAEGSAVCRLLTDEEAEASTRHSGRLTGHRLTEALALESGGQVGVATGEKTGKEFHDTSPCSRVTRGAFA